MNPDEWNKLYPDGVAVDVIHGAVVVQAHTTGPAHRLNSGLDVVPVRGDCGAFAAMGVPPVTRVLLSAVRPSREGA